MERRREKFKEQSLIRQSVPSDEISTANGTTSHKNGNYKTVARRMQNEPYR